MQISSRRVIYSLIIIERALQLAVNVPKTSCLTVADLTDNWLFLHTL